MEKFSKYMLAFALGFFVFFMVTTIYPKGKNYYDGYKSGQIDAINGNVKYERVTHNDQTVTWEEIKGE